jgi:Flp pilus assembly protein TadB
MEAMMERMQPESTSISRADPFASATTGELLGALAKQSGDLVKKEIELAKAEVRLDVKREVQMAAGLGVAAFFAFAACCLVVVAAVLALATVLPAWASALVVAGVMVAISAVAAAVGWKRRVKQPLDKTQKTLKEDARWMKQRVA